MWECGRVGDCPAGGDPEARERVVARTPGVGVRGSSAGNRQAADPDPGGPCYPALLISIGAVLAAAFKED